MELKLGRLAIAALVAATAIGCGQGEDAKKAHLDAPTVKEKLSREQSAKDRQLSPATANSMDARPK
ncbi:MAG TPA: hypothetical protein VGE01_02980 [Fimbriimonas sp.]